MGLKGALVFVAVASLAAGIDVSIGKTDTGKKILDSFEEASPAIWKQIKNITVNATGDDVISAIVVTDLREDKGGEVLIESGGLGFKDVTLELKSPTILRGYHYHIEVYSAPASQVSKEIPGLSTEAPKAVADKTTENNLGSTTSLPDTVKIPLDETDKTTARTARDTVKVSTPKNATPLKTEEVSTTPSSETKDKQIKVSPQSPAIDALQPALQRQDSYPPVAKTKANEPKSDQLSFKIPAEEQVKTNEPTSATTPNAKADEALKSENKDVKSKAISVIEEGQVNHTLQSRGTDEVNKNVNEEKREENLTYTTTITPDLANKQSKDAKVDDKKTLSSNVTKHVEVSTHKVNKRDTNKAAEKANPATTIPAVNDKVAGKNQTIDAAKVAEVNNKSSTKDLPLELKDVKGDNNDDDDDTSSKEVAKPSALKQGPKEGHPLNIRDTKVAQEEKKVTVPDKSIPVEKSNSPIDNKNKQEPTKSVKNTNTPSIENKNKPEPKKDKAGEKVLTNNPAKTDEAKTFPVEIQTEKRHVIKTRQIQDNANATQDLDSRNGEADVIVPEQVQDQEESGEIPAETNQNVPLPYRFNHNEETTVAPANGEKEVSLGKDVDIDEKFAHDNARTTRKPSEVETADATTVAPQ